MSNLPPVICTKITMFRAGKEDPNYTPLYPNFRHTQKTTRGLHLPSLSPMTLGPVNHNQPHLPPSRNLENFHQGNKVFLSEVDANQRPTTLFFQNQQAMYNADTPYRHKRAFVGKSSSFKGHKPLYSLWVTPDRVAHQINYIESRQFYCHFYELLAEQQADLHRLRQMLKDNHRFQIMGYDAYPVTDSIDKHYLDPARPFGHEMVLFTLLTVDDPTQYPWRKFQNPIYFPSLTTLPTLPLPTSSPSPTSQPTVLPSPSSTPTSQPTVSPSPSSTPTSQPTVSPSPSSTPSSTPTSQPTVLPSPSPTSQP